MAKRVLEVVVDFQNDFVLPTGALPVPQANTIIGDLNKHLAGLDRTEVAGVLFTFDTHNPEAYAVSEEAKMFPIHCVKPTPGWQLAVDQTQVPEGIPVYVLDKGVFDMWAEPDVKINGLLRSEFVSFLKKANIDTVRVTGVATNFCVKWAVAGFVNAGFTVILMKNLVKGIDTGNGEYDTDPWKVFATEIAEKKVFVV